VIKAPNLIVQFADFNREEPERESGSESAKQLSQKKEGKKKQRAKEKTLTAIKGKVLVILAYLHLAARVEHHTRRPHSKSRQEQRRQPLWKLNPEAPPSLTSPASPSPDTDPNSDLDPLEKPFASAKRRENPASTTTKNSTRRRRKGVILGEDVR